MEKSKRVFKTKETVDINSGELVVSEIEYRSETEPSYFKSYCNDLASLHKLNNATKSVLWFLAKKMDFQNQIIVNVDLKEQAVSEIGIKIDMVNKAISTLYKTDILLKRNKTRRGVYIVNPKYFAKGSWKDIKALRMTVLYEGTNRYIVTEFSKNDD
jgi:hypothetical protein